MKACKIILIIIYVATVLRDFSNVFFLEGDEQFKALLTAILDTVVYGLLYLGAGIFDLN